MLRETGPVENIFHEIAKIEQLSFDFGEESQVCFVKIFKVIGQFFGWFILYPLWYFYAMFMQIVIVVPKWSKIE